MYEEIFVGSLSTPVISLLVLRHMNCIPVHMLNKRFNDDDRMKQAIFNCNQCIISSNNINGCHHSLQSKKVNPSRCLARRERYMRSLDVMVD